MVDQRNDIKTLEAQIAKQKARTTTCTLMLSTAWIASSYWTFNGLMMTAEENATSGFTGAVQALIASIVSAVVVAGSCSMLLAFSGDGDGHE
ncbi:hypothetical protein [Novosphingobium beihaiensis]|uniref:TMhelix containing protein n=1 Tax=Novosphingobium beihaiensis TaxID=2930389 RepID=A0ABT0BS51_9SPHN|nr:hypothetical protein [Novosphingobium beihaiensis]MCJ2187895.1 hypothetical protein [Novosphingobium beihaiensis]